MPKTELQDQYALKIVAQINEMITSEDCPNKLDDDVFSNNEKLTAFMHALFNLAPTFIYNKIAAEEVDILGANHIANRLVFQFGKSEEKG